MSNQLQSPSLLDRAVRLAGSALPSADAARELAESDIDPVEVARLGAADPGRPYGRRVLAAGPAFEIMLATWTRGAPCAPHDHGGSCGFVRVLSGEALHTLYAVGSGRLRPMRRDRITAGTVMRCGPDLVHAMVDAGAADPLVTLHVYYGPIPSMAVYDLAGNRTLLVSGESGAWLPAPEHILEVHPGIRRLDRDV